MNRIDEIFASLRARNGRAVMPFLTAGYPSLESTAAALRAAERAGASICEIGIPFSDPIADGPIIQASMTEALNAGCTLGDVFELVRSLRGELTIGLVAMVSYSIVYRMGVERFAARAAEAGFDGLLIPDLPREEAAEAREQAAGAGLTCSLFVAPTTPPDRAKEIAAMSTGFIYVLARTGITGERSELPADLASRLEQLSAVTELPLVVGFGISNAQQVRAATRQADAAIVGSAFVKKMGSLAGEPVKAQEEALTEYISELVGGLDAG